MKPESKWSVMDLVTGKDGKLVLTKMSAASFHLVLFLTVSAISAVRIYKYFNNEQMDWPGVFDGVMWGIYGSFAVVHAIVDKTGTQITQFKEKQLEQPAPGYAQTVETKTTSTSKALDP